MNNSELKTIRELNCIHPDGSKSSVLLRLGSPYPKGKSYRVYVAIIGIDNDDVSHPIGGIDPLQTIHLGIKFINSFLDDFVSKSGKLFYGDTDQPYEIGNIDIG